MAEDKKVAIKRKMKELKNELHSIEEQDRKKHAKQMRRVNEQKFEDAAYAAIEIKKTYNSIYCGDHKSRGRYLIKGVDNVRKLGVSCHELKYIERVQVGDETDWYEVAYEDIDWDPY